MRWQMGVKEDGSDSIAVQVADENVSQSTILIVLVCFSDLIL